MRRKKRELEAEIARHQRRMDAITLKDAERKKTVQARQAKAKAKKLEAEHKAGMLKKILDTLEAKLSNELKGYSALKMKKDRELDEKF